ncbi:uncharacterized protein K460DRAFT_67228 [Cucurbitaria berberidis CBS 394.84]|uniref:Secreted protein n=1 Tax=Cucurbitaria berberidis CBS 394.84 TaxID=1168544 RepID=A0A9P4LA56_9PLEO|nr:uncharacterized protein K460DRAFT_67228 [Cucurbitaria berberidis CBS 394.84]KAF1848031.1 hypothetical protein K460DRAFT_67228 [Cucurbitaria berberidis CBS 394.84]
MGEFGIRRFLLFCIRFFLHPLPCSSRLPILQAQGAKEQNRSLRWHPSRIHQADTTPDNLILEQCGGLHMTTVFSLSLAITLKVS